MANCKCNNSLSDVLDLFFPLDWDKKSYYFNRAEKDMNPYSVVNKENSIIITHNVLGINQKDLNVSLKVENRVPYIIIEGKTKDALTEKEYSINSRFNIDDNQLDTSNIILSMANGLLYIEIPYKKENKTQERVLKIANKV